MKFEIVYAGFLFIFLLTSCVTGGIPDGDVDIPSFGNVKDVDYAGKLWNAMEGDRLVGRNEKKLEPFFGGAKPHGMILEIANQNIKVDNHDGFIVVKKNYDEVGATVESVKNNRSRFLSSITVMYQRENGYDADNQDWFWVKYNPDGSLFRSKIDDKEVQMAGRIWKGNTVDQNSGCLYCHRSAGGGDYIFYPEITIPGTG